MALAAWSDTTPETLAPYEITESDLGQISQGFEDGSWGPQQPLLRQHFVKMAVAAFGLAPLNPAESSFLDVEPSDPFYGYVEAAAAAGLTQGVGGGRFDPSGQITREQAVAVIARYLAQANEVDLAVSYGETVQQTLLASFADEDAISPGLRSEMAYAVEKGVVRGSQGWLEPQQILIRIQGATLLLRAREDSDPMSSTSTTHTSTTHQVTTITGSTTSSTAGDSTSSSAGTTAPPYDTTTSIPTTGSITTATSGHTTTTLVGAGG